MEKDYFLDRSYASTENYLLHIGDVVYICEKHMQKTAKELKDLTQGTIIQKLTSSLQHPRGVKVQIKTKEGRLAIGRVTYLCDENGEPLRTNRN